MFQALSLCFFIFFMMPAKASNIEWNSHNKSENPSSSDCKKNLSNFSS